MIPNREFLGEFTRYEVEAKGERIIVDQSHYANHPLRSIDSEVAVGIELNQICLLPSEY